MQIDPKSGLNISAPPQTAVGGVDRSGAESTQGAVDATAFLPTAALSGLLGQLLRIPDVRDDVILHVRERIAKGDLLTPIASAATAQAILGTETPV
jgi:hypothetical protein